MEIVAAIDGSEIIKVKNYPHPLVSGKICRPSERLCAFTEVAGTAGGVLPPVVRSVLVNG